MIIIMEIPTSTRIVSYLCMAVSMLFGITGVMACTCELLFWIGVQFFKVKIMPLSKIPLRVMDLLGFTVGVGLECAWFFTGYNWIISNIIYILIFLAIIKFIKFDSLKIAAITFACTAFCNIIFIVLTQFVRQIYFNDLILYIFNNPLFIFCPCINFIPNQTCSWFFISCIAYPGILLCYLDRVD